MLITGSRAGGAARGKEVPQIKNNRLSHRSELFTVRLWPEELGESQVEWRGRVQHALSGRTCHFRAWPELFAFFMEFVAAETEAAIPPKET